MNDVLLDRPGGGLVLLSAQAMQVIRKHSQNHISGTEAGGILLGCYKGPHVEIVSATAPGPNDIRSRYRFDRRCGSHQRSATKAWLESKHLVTYIGEWHTHPERVPFPSDIDHREWKKSLCDRLMVLCIQGIDDIWVGESTGKHTPVQRLIRINN